MNDTARRAQMADPSSRGARVKGGIVDAALLEALRHSDDAPDDRLYPWLRRFVRQAIAREVAEARRRRRERSLDEPVGQGWPDEEGSGRPRRLIDILPDPTSPIPEQVAESADFQRALANLLTQVPASWREPFLLHDYHGLPLARVARLEGLPVTEVRRRVEQTRAFLRARLVDEYDEAAMPPPETIFAFLDQIEPSPEHVARTRDRLAGASS